MPWTPADAERHTKAANTPRKQQRWAKVANKVLRKTGDEGQAVRTANASVGQKQRQRWT